MFSLNSFVVFMWESFVLARCAKLLLVLIICGLVSPSPGLMGEIQLVFGIDGYCSGSFKNVRCWPSSQDIFEANLRFLVLALV